MTMRQDCEAIIKQLESCGIKEWAEVWVNHRIRFHRAYCMGYIFSTLHGTEFFPPLSSVWMEPHGRPATMESMKKISESSLNIIENNYE